MVGLIWHSLSQQKVQRKSDRRTTENEKKHECMHEKFIVISGDEEKTRIKENKNGGECNIQFANHYILPTD